MNTSRASRRRICHCLIACIGPFIAGCAMQQGDAPATKPVAPWYLGADVSGLVGGRAGGGTTRLSTNPSTRPNRVPAAYRENGVVDSEINIMSRHGWNAYRLRVFVSPVRSAPNNSLENTIALAKQIKAANAMFLLDIHYSDTWADPQHQETPVAWRHLDAAGLEKQVEEYTADVLQQLKAAGASPDMVQVGNEITGGMLWPLGHVKVPDSAVKTDTGKIQPLPEPYYDAAQWANLIRFFKAGVRAVRAHDPSIKVVLHIDCGGDWPITKSSLDHFAEANCDYDIIGQSFYPTYHGTLAGVRENIAESARRYHKPVMYVETGYPQTGGTQATTRKYMDWPATPQGQLQFMADLINTVKSDPNGIGVFYWAPEAQGRGNGMWNADGSPAPSISVLDHLQTLTTRPASHLP